MAYQALLEDPRWQRKRLEILQRDEWECVRCGRGDLMLVVHHRYYRAHLPWECPDSDLETLCRPCHNREHAGSDSLTLFSLRQMVEHAHACRDWDAVWKWSHLVNFDGASCT